MSTGHVDRVWFVAPQESLGEDFLLQLHVAPCQSAISQCDCLRDACGPCTAAIALPRNFAYPADRFRAIIRLP